MSDAALLDASASASAPRDRRWNGPLELLPEELEPISRANLNRWIWFFRPGRVGAWCAYLRFPCGKMKDTVSNFLT